MDMSKDTLVKSLSLREVLISKSVKCIVFSIGMVFFSSVIAADPESSIKHLRKALAYYKSGDYASAKLEFESVLQLDDLPLYLHQQTEIYTAIAEEYLAGKKFLPSGYAMLGFGNYRENATRAGSGEINDNFLNTRVGGRLNYVVSDYVNMNNNLDYRFREYSDRDRRVDSDLRWNSSFSRNFDEDNWEMGIRGRVSYRGEGQYRNDYGLFSNYRMLVDEKNQVTLGAEMRRRMYPEGPLRERSRNIAEFTGNWTHSLMNGKASFSLDVFGGLEHATNNRPDGNSNFYGLLPTLNLTFNDQWGGFVFFRWQNDRYNSERYLPEPADDMVLVATRNDDLYEVGGGVTWEFKKGWQLNPEILYIHDKSNILVANYSSTELWVNLRFDFS
jgi:hypothetical protein